MKREPTLQRDVPLTFRLLDVLGVFRVNEPETTGRGMRETVANRRASSCRRLSFFIATVMIPGPRIVNAQLNVSPRDSVEHSPLYSQSISTPATSLSV